MMLPTIAVAWWLTAMSAQAAPAPEPQHAQTARDMGEASAGEPAFAGERVKVKLVFPAMSAAAKRFINLPMGSERYATVNGKHYVFVLEHHYHPPGFVGAPVGDHKGVTMYELR